MSLMFVNPYFECNNVLLDLKNPCFAREGWYNGYHNITSKRISLSPQNQKESDLSHLGDLFDILCGHFDEKQNCVYHLHRG